MLSATFLTIPTAKAAQREREVQAAASSSSRNANGKRPLDIVASSSTSPTAPGPKGKDKSQFGKYFDYDLSKMVNSKGGFLVEDGKEVDEDFLRKEKARERQRAKQNMEPRQFLAFVYLCTA